MQVKRQYGKEREQRKVKMLQFNKKYHSVANGTRESLERLLYIDFINAKKTKKSRNKKKTDQNEAISRSFSICMCMCASFTILLIDIAFNPI